MPDQIKKSFIQTKQYLNEHQNYPAKSGIYAFYLSDNSDLFDFGKGGQLIYVGIAKGSFHDRDFNQHFKTGKTGSSTLRRSIGAILKTHLNLTAIPRGAANDTKRFENYKFKDDQPLTDWMMANLQIGYWVPNNILTYSELREIEKNVTLDLKPTLDLDIRTRRFNAFADKLVALRNVCKTEAGKK
jgi:hypothetical protein